jgi:hypothetical protein
MLNFKNIIWKYINEKALSDPYKFFRRSLKIKLYNNADFIFVANVLVTLIL